MSAAADSNPPGELYCTTCERTFHAGDRCPTDGTRLLRLKTRIDPFLGRDLDGRYTVLEKLGQGGMGAVYRAEQHSVGREVAVKVVNTSLVTDAEVIKRFLREAKLASKLAHPNAVAVLDFNQTEDGVFYLVMELVSGRTLDQVIRSERVFKPERVVRIGTQVLDALDGAHALSIVHRDLKPSNIMLLSQGRDLVKVLDFGLAKSVSPDATSTTMTGIGAVVGTPAFMPPELATGQPCDGRADLYSLGVILYLLGSGRLPFASESVHELVAMHGSAEPAPPMTGVPHRLAQVIDRLLQKDPAKRYQTAAEALQALETSLAIVTPPHGIQAWPSDTQPSIGPFPASSEQFQHLDTPVPPSLAGDNMLTAPTPRERSDRRARSETELQRIVTGETMLATSGEPVPATSQLDLAPRRPPKPWKLVGVGVVLASAALVFALTRGGDDGTPPKQPELAKEPPVREPEPVTPAVEPTKVTDPPPEPTKVDEPVPAPETHKTVDSDRTKKSDPKRDKRDKKPPVVKPPPTVTKPPPTTPPPPTPTDTGSGSGKKPAPLPF